MKYEIYKESVDKLINWAKAYYVDDNPIATDEEYDRLYHQVLEYEESNPDDILANSPTQRVGDKIIDGFSKSSHIKPMWSMEDIFDNEELIKWIDRVKKTTTKLPKLFCEPKFDGASMNLLYQNGNLIKATTRGDGRVGEDVTHNIKTMHSIPLSIDYYDTIEIRGEVVIRKDDFDIVNIDRVASGKEAFANPRNASSGSLRQLDPKESAKRKLIFYPWGLGENSLDNENLSDKMKFISTLGFLAPPTSREVSSIEEIEEYYHYLIASRDDIAMMMDGMVIKVDNIKLQEMLGYTNKYPKWMVAYKFPAIEKVTKIKAITLQVGRTGVVTPVAEVEEVDIDGAMVNRATLHNFDEITKKDLRVGDSVIIIRSGDVIPKITKVLKDRRDGSEIEIKRATKCPNCDKELLDEGILLKCQNISCSARVISNIKYFASKGCMNIDGLGEAIIKTLYDNKIVVEISNLYSIDRDEVLKLEGFKERRVDKLIASIESSKGVEAWRFLRSLGAEHIGETASKKICDKFGLKFFDITKESLLEIDGIGEQIADSFVEFMRVNRDKVQELMEIIKPIIIEKEEILETPFRDKKVVLTGTMSQSRGEIKKILETLGATVGSAVSKKTDFLIYGESAGSKLSKAKSLGVRTLREDEMREMLGDKS
ncbi:DNA ligase [hydrothermal vent metagenome]|uniref:DNA ligase (NAD(+)) n=1 Tax=hydrothermal vent metagenome TaxID=652676 RepID=A0A1W1EKM0_9ZZZZ